MSQNDLRPLLENRGLDDVLKDKKLFIVDYRILDGIKGMPNKTVVHIFYYLKHYPHQAYASMLVNGYDTIA